MTSPATRTQVQAYEALTALAHIADETGYHTVWAADHFQPFPAEPDFVFESILEQEAARAGPRRAEDVLVEVEGG